MQHSIYILDAEGKFEVHGPSRGRRQNSNQEESQDAWIHTDAKTRKRMKGNNESHSFLLGKKTVHPTC
jgi:hypothetical protein